MCLSAIVGSQKGNNFQHGVISQKHCSGNNNKNDIRDVNTLCMQKLIQWRGGGGG